MRAAPLSCGDLLVASRDLQPANRCKSECPRPRFHMVIYSKSLQISCKSQAAKTLVGYSAYGRVQIMICTLICSDLLAANHDLQAANQGWF